MAHQTPRRLAGAAKTLLQRRWASSGRPTPPQVAPPLSQLRSFPSAVKLVGIPVVAAAAAYTLWPATAEEPGSGSAEELPLAYDAGAIAKYWSSRPGAVAARIGTICTELCPLTFQLFLDLKTRSSPLSPEEKASRAADVAAALTRLGPLFIKFGQMLSIRPDLVPPEVRRVSNFLQEVKGDLFFASANRLLPCGHPFVHSCRGS